MDVARKLIELLSPRERVHLAMLFAVVLVMAFLEMLSVASVLPFLSVAADPGKIQTNAWLNWVYGGLGFASANQFLLALAGGALLALLLSNAWLAATQWAQIRFAMGRSHSLSVRLLQHYLDQPYAFFLQRNSADLGKNILSETDQVTAVLIAGLRLSAKAMMALAIVATLIAFDPVLSLILTAVLGLAYGALYAFTRHRLSRLGTERVEANRERYQLMSEAFGAIKDVKLLGCEKVFRTRFIEPSRRFNYSQATSTVIAEMPRYGLEVLAFGGVLVIAIYLLLRGEGLQQTIPVLGFYAFAGYRLMPSLQQIFSGYAKLRFGAPAVDNLHRELLSKPEGREGSDASVWRAPAGGEGRAESLPLARRLELDGVSFTYPGAREPVLQDVTLSIEANSTIGVVGVTGSGKTTLIDIILGLLQPDDGRILVDGAPLTGANISAWRRGIGYVPQHIHLMDDSIARNIAFGAADTEIDRRAVERAAAIANINDFIAKELPEGYDTAVGERGVRLSGGQRQRIGIARALYRDPGMLVFDEATSALDNDTEAAVIEAINELAGRRTILMIAHRLTTLDACQKLLRMRDGRVWVETRGDSQAALAVAR